jgi:hypothetical protein
VISYLASVSKNGGFRDISCRQCPTSTFFAASLFNTNTEERLSESVYELVITAYMFPMASIRRGMIGPEEVGGGASMFPSFSMAKVGGDRLEVRQGPPGPDVPGIALRPLAVLASSYPPLPHTASPSKVLMFWSKFEPS